MIICRLNDDGTPQTLERMKEMVRLAHGLDHTHHLDHATQERALACLERFGQRIANLPPHYVAVVGTNTLRVAKNAQHFIAKAEKALGHTIDVISGIEEARLVYQGVTFSLGGSPNRRFVMDIGGSSTEYIIGQHDVAHTKESLNMGCVTFSEHFFENGAISKKAFNNAVLQAEKNLEPFRRKFERAQWDEAIGSSGSLKSINNVLESSGWSHNGITLAGLEQLIDQLLKYRKHDEFNFPALSLERRPVFIGAVAIVYASFQALGIEKMTVSDGALREGLICDLANRIKHHDIRAKTSHDIAKHYHADLKHAANIKKTLHQLAAQLGNHPAFAPDQAADTLQFLDWAAELHEIGLEIAHNDYHKHSAYIIEHGDLAGFSKQNQLVLAKLVRNHRKKFNLKHFEELPKPWRDHAPIMSILFRLSRLIHRGRPQTAPEIKIAIQNQEIRLRFKENWLRQAPLTQADLEQEAEYLQAAKFELKFE